MYEGLFGFGSKKICSGINFCKIGFGKSDFLDLVNFDFLDLVDFTWLTDFRNFHQLYHH